EHSLGRDRQCRRRKFRRQHDPRTGCGRPYVEGQGHDGLPVKNRTELTLRGNAMNAIRPLLATVLAGLLLVANPARSEDIDLYTGPSAGGGTNALILLDTPPHW